MINEKDYVRKAQNGDKDAYGNLYEKYSLDMYKFALYMLHNEDDSADAVQNTAVKGFIHIKDLKNPSSFKVWYFKILSNECKIILSKRILTEDIEKSDELPRSDDFTVSEEIFGLLESLDEESRQIIIMSTVHKYKSREIAEILGCPAGTVRSKLSRALSKLRSEIDG